MEEAVLKKVQPVLLEMLKEIDRVCRENGISYFLYRGTFLGAVRHQGFIPWDDDLDVAMLREDYEKFCRVAPQKLNPRYTFQNWHTDPRYAHPFGKLRKRNTLYVEAKSGKPLAENGFYVDVYPLDAAPEDYRPLARKLMHLYRLKLVKSGYTPWQEGTRTIWKKRVGYLAYQLAAAFLTQEQLIEKYEALVRAVPLGTRVYEQSALPRDYLFDIGWCRQLKDYPFEDGFFPGPAEYDSFLTNLYGDYMQLPPEGQRENRHQILKMDFGTEGDCGK